MTDNGTRRELLERRLRQRMAERSFALSYPQQRLWFLDQLDPASAVYIVPIGYRIRGALDAGALERAITDLVRRHQVLRTVFRAVDGVPRQFVQAAGPVPLPVVDLSGGPDAAGEADRRCAQEARRPFDLAADLMVRPLLLRLGPGEHRLCLTMHHIVCDGWSLGVLGAELSELYRGHLGIPGRALPVLPVQYADHAERQVARLTGATLQEMLGYWRERLADLPALSGLPTDRPRPPVQSHAGACVGFDIDPSVVVRVDELARATGATPFAVLLAGFAALAHAYTDAAEVVVGSPVAGRERADLQPLVGLFANTVVMRVETSGDPTFAELVARTRDESRAALAHQELPFEKIVEELHPHRDPAYNPLFQLMVSYHDAETGTPALPGCEVGLVPGDTATSKFDLTLSLTRTGPHLQARLEYSTDLFDDDTAVTLSEQFGRVLACATADPTLPIGRLPVLSSADRRRILVDWNPRAQPIPAALVHELIAAQAARTPDAPALRSADAAGPVVTYRELMVRSGALAARLCQHGVGTGSPVGVYLDRSPDLVVTLLAVLRAGGCYLPLDPGFPPDRLAFMVADSRVAVIVSRGTLTRRITALPVTVVESDTSDVTAGTPSDLPQVSPADLAYVIYTSGSTGRPKGVMISHHNVVNFFAGMDAVLGEDRPDTWLAVTSMSFDISVLELLWTLARGYAVVVRGDEPTSTPAAGGVPVPAAVQARPADFSLFYFGGDRGGDPGRAYRLLVEGAQFADRNGFRAVWTPERHFHEFGGLYPNPAVTASAIATITERVELRAGSVVLPLHDPLQVAEEWSVVDNLSGGRVGISVASGWQPDDFVLAPDDYADRKKIMVSKVAELRTLWGGGSVRRRNGVDTEIDVRIFPAPCRPELPIWVTSARSPETFQMAGEIGAGLLTHLLGHTPEQLAQKIVLYRQAWREHGHPGAGQVTLMLHTFVGTDVDAVRETVRRPLCDYIKSSLDLLSGLSQSMGQDVDLRALPGSELDELVEQAFDRFFETSGLLGTPEHCADLVDRLKGIGVDEIACLIDFGVPHQQVLDALEHLVVVKELSEDRRRTASADEPIAAQLRRHDVTHLQCTPSVVGMLVDDPDSAAALSGLRRLLVGGEALPEPLAISLAELVPDGVHNMYGPTEATVWATTSPVGGNGPVLIGRPMTNVRAYVVDRHLRPTPANVPGELLLGGTGIARGYLGRPALTAERFVPDLFTDDPGARLYRTGDLVRWRAAPEGGRLEFLGRLDHQVKLHGHRIELGEIENTLRAHPDVRAAVASVRGEGARRRIVAYCVRARAGAGLTAAALTASAGRTLPDYMVPADVVFLDELPMTPNGKIDRNRLPDPELPRPDRYRPPGNDVERRVAEALAGVLTIDRLGVEDNFFESGGNSLLAVQARARLLPVLGERLSLVDIFRYPTVRGLVAAHSGDPAAGAGLDGVRQAVGRRAGALARQARARRERTGA